MHQHSLFESLFKRKTTDPETAGFLEQLTLEHPYFSPAQFYLLQQTDKENNMYSRQASRTALFFDNPFWLNFQLKQASQALVEKNAQVVNENSPAEVVPENSDYDDDNVFTEKEIAPIKIELKISDDVFSTAEQPLLFEPMHLVDYFASQGIKLSEESQTADKLGKQLKSFTEWLKTMKKVNIGGETMVIRTDGLGGKDTPETTQTETNIRSLAEKSNTEDEVLTESMAEVLAKQGKAGKAMELYLKLSLLNPSKIAYFAAKIEQLKDI